MNSLTLKRILKTAFQNMWRNKFLSLATVVVMTLILFIFNVILIINLTVDKILNELNQKVDIIIYLKDTTDVLQVQNIIDEIKQVEGVKDAKYTSKEEALQNMLQTYSTIEDPFNKYGLENKLPPNIQILTESPEYHKKIISFLTSSSYNDLFINIESNQETQQIAEKLTNISRASKTVGLSMLISFIIGGIMIVLNAIQLTIYNRKQEIYIMKLVGANITFIKLPFIIEGMLLGLTAAIINIIAVITLTGRFKIPYEQVENAIAQLQHTSLLQLIISAIIGGVGSLLATNKYLLGKNSQRID